MDGRFIRIFYQGSANVNDLQGLCGGPAINKRPAQIHRDSVSKHEAAIYSDQIQCHEFQFEFVQLRRIRNIIVKRKLPTRRRAQRSTRTFSKLLIFFRASHRFTRGKFKPLQSGLGTGKTPHISRWFPRCCTCRQSGEFRVCRRVTRRVHIRTRIRVGVFCVNTLCYFNLLNYCLLHNQNFLNMDAFYHYDQNPKLLCKKHHVISYHYIHLTMGIKVSLVTHERGIDSLRQCSCRKHFPPTTIHWSNVEPTTHTVGQC